MLERYSSRKFLLVVGSLILFTSLLLCDKLPASIYENLCYLCLVGYLTSNVAQKYSPEATPNTPNIVNNGE